MYAELAEDEEGSPVVEGGLLKPRLAVEEGGDAGAEMALEGVGRIEAVQHLVGDLGVTGLVCADQAEAVSAEQGDLSVEEEEEGEDEEDRGLAQNGPAREAPAGHWCRFGKRLVFVHVHSLVQLSVGQGFARQAPPAGRNCLPCGIPRGVP